MGIEPVQYKDGRFYINEPSWTEQVIEYWSIQRFILSKNDNTMFKFHNPKLLFSLISPHKFTWDANLRFQNHKSFYTNDLL